MTRDSNLMKSRRLGIAPMLLAALLALQLPGSASAQEQRDAVADFRARICGAISTMVLDRNVETHRPAQHPSVHGGSEYDGRQSLYQTLVFNAAGILPSDSFEQGREKIQQFWNETGRHHRCAQRVGFIPGGGNLIKYAVRRGQGNFLREAILRWHLDPNTIDPADGRTALDYVHDEMAYLEGGNSYDVLNSYLQMMRRFGEARYRVEIDGVDCRLSSPERRHRSCPDYRRPSVLPRNIPPPGTPGGRQDLGAGRGG